MNQRIFTISFLLLLSLPGYNQDTSKRRDKDIYLYGDHIKSSSNPTLINKSII